MDLSLRLLRVALELAQTNSFTRAAENLGVGQPQVSASIRELERRIGLKLFQRTSRKVGLSIEGQRLMPAFQRIVDVNSDAIGLAHEIRRGDVGHLKIATAPYHSETRWKVLSAFLERYPSVDLRISIVQNAGDLFQALRDNHFDVAFGHAPIPAEFDRLLLLRGPSGLLVHEDSKLAEQSVIELDQLAGTSVALFPRWTGPWLHAKLSQLLEAHRVEIVELPEPTVDGQLFFAQSMRIPVLCIRWWEHKMHAPRSLRHIPLAGNTINLDYHILRTNTPASSSALRLWRVAQRLAAKSKVDQG